MLCANLFCLPAAAWKLLGDVLVLHHAVTPSARHPSIPATSSSCSAQELEGQLDAWRRRVEAMRQGRRAYAKALHLNPAQSGAWQDAAFAYHHEAQVGNCVPKVDGLAACCLPAAAAFVPQLLSSHPACCLRAAAACAPSGGPCWLGGTQLGGPDCRC